MSTYSEKRTVQLGETGPGGRIKISSLFNHLQGVTGAHSHSIGFGTADILKEGFTWVISRYRLSIASLPALFESFTISTWRSGETGNFAIREYLLSNGSGAVLTRGTSSWVLLDFRNGRAVAPSSRHPDYPINPERALDDRFESIPVVSNPVYEKEFIVRRGDLDINNHVNNAYYIAWMVETGEDVIRHLDLSDISVSFKGEAKYGDTVISQVSGDGRDGRLVHRLSLKGSGRELTRGITEWHRRTAPDGQDSSSTIRSKSSSE